jgi:hypothetical protein
MDHARMDSLSPKDRETIGREAERLIRSGRLKVRDGDLVPGANGMWGVKSGDTIVAAFKTESAAQLFLNAIRGSIAADCVKAGRPGTAPGIAVQATKSAAKPSRNRSSPTKVAEVVEAMRRSQASWFSMTPDQMVGKFKGSHETMSRGTICKALAIFLNVSDKRSRSFKAMLPMLKLKMLK